MRTRAWLWLRSLVERRRFERDLDDELRFHLQARTEHWRREGLSTGEAARHARLEFGGLDAAKDRVRDVRFGAWVKETGQDVRYGVRVLARRPGFTVAATLTLALGVGATATVFTVLDTVLLRPLPVRAASELAHVYTSCRRGDPYCANSYPEFEDYRVQNRTFTDLAAFTPTVVNASADSGTWVAESMLVSTNYFDLLGVMPQAGRLFGPGDDGRDPVVVLGHDAWRDRFGSSAEAVGQTIRLSGVPFRVVGVVPPGFRGTRLPQQPDLWIPITVFAALPQGMPRAAMESRGNRWISGTVGRLRPGRTIAQAQVDLSRVSEGLQASDPTRAGRFVTVESATTLGLPAHAAGDIRQFVMLLMAGVGATLAIACANVAGLLLARGAARRRELAVRRALGAGRGRLVRQLLAEYATLSVAGAAGGLMMSVWAMDLLSAYDLPGGVSIASLDLRLDVRVFGFAALLAGVATLFGLVPALGTTRDLVVTTDGRSTPEGSSTVRGQGVILSGQVAVTVVLLFGAGLFLQSLRHGLALDLGLTHSPVVMATVAPALEGYSAERMRIVLGEATTRVAALPGIQRVSTTVLPPLAPAGLGVFAEIDGYVPAPDEELRIEINLVGPTYFATMGIALRSGRDLDETDRERAPLVAVINETMARRYWGGRDPVGSRFSAGQFGQGIQVIGVARDVTAGLDGAQEPYAYLPILQHVGPALVLGGTVILAQSAFVNTVPVASVRRALEEVDATLPITELTTLQARVGELLMPQRLGSALLTVLAGLTVLLVTVGLMGSVAFTVSRRRREIGVRLTLGARHGQVVAAIAGGALVPVVVGTGIGLVTSAALGRLAERFLYGVPAGDLPTLVGAGLVMAAAASSAAYLAARQAARVNPREVLAAE